MFNYKVDLQASILVIFISNVICASSFRDISNDCVEPYYVTENHHPKFEIKDIVLLSCGRAKRDTSSTVNNLTTTNSTSGQVSGTTVNSAASGTNITSTTTLPLPLINGTSENSSFTKIQTPATTPGTLSPKTSATLVNVSLTTDSSAKKNAGQNPNKIELNIPIHNLGENGTGIRHITTQCNATKSNRTTNTTACVSDPIVPEEGNSDINLDDFVKPAEKLFGEHNVTNFKTDYHSYYNSTMTSVKTEFNEYWDNVVMRNVSLFEELALSHRKAIQHDLRFVFPFYGQPVDSVLVTSGGFLFTGPNIHFWLAATHYIAPLMANFESTQHEDSVIRFYDNGTCLTTVWENLTLNDLPRAGTFTFSTTIFDDGNIIFAYKDLPLTIGEIPTDNHPVKIGLSDAYEVDHIDFFVRHKLILEYHQIDFKNHSITNNTLIRLIPLPTCPMYNTCKTCLDNDSNFVCSWCSKVQRCSSGLDRLEQEWYSQNCRTERIDNSSFCSPLDNLPTNRRRTINGPKTDAAQSSSTSSGGIIACLLAFIALGGCVGWVVYAYRNPHTNSGQLLIKYRPSQWTWRRGEARYTAATIHM